MDDSHQYHLPGSAVIGSGDRQYAIGNLIGRGGFGITYHGQDPQGRVYAIKEYFPTELAGRVESYTVAAYSGSEYPYNIGLENFRREAEILTRIDHPSIVSGFDFFEQNGTAYIVMEYVYGQTLEQWLVARGDSNPVSEREISRIFCPLLSGLQEMHARDMWHRDIKPDNIMIRDNGDPVLIDFGAARESVSSSSKSIPIVADGYSPVEQYASGVKRGPWTDLYSLGATIHRCIAGEPPPSSPARQTAVIDQNNDPLIATLGQLEGKYSRELLDVVNWCLQLRTADRPHDAGLVQQRLESVLPAVASPAKDRTPNFLWPAIGVLACILVGLAIWQYSRSMSGSEPIKFMMGSSQAEIQEALAVCNSDTNGACVEEWFAIERQSEVELTPFVLDIAEVSVEDFARFVEETGHVTDAEKAGFSRRENSDATIVELPDHTWRQPYGPEDDPHTRRIRVVHVSFNDAEAYCASTGKRLPTRAEWELIALTTERHQYGSYFSSDKFIKGAMPVSVDSEDIYDRHSRHYGLTGNVWEWVDTPEPTYPGSRYTKGGSWNEASSAYLRATSLRPQPKNWSYIDLGFRCARDVRDWPGAISSMFAGDNK